MTHGATQTRHVALTDGAGHRIRLPVTGVVGPYGRIVQATCDPSAQHGYNERLALYGR
jgi:hypothetical protein